MDKKLLLFTKTVGNPTRLKILNLLKKECCVSELWKKLNLSQNLVSHHLKMLKNAELITSDKHGLKVVYRQNKRVVSQNIDLLSKYIK